MRVLVLSEPRARRSHADIASEVQLVAEIPCVPVDRHDERLRAMRRRIGERIDDVRADECSLTGDERGLRGVDVDPA